LKDFPKKEGRNIFDSIFIENIIAPPKEKIELAEYLIENYGYIDYA